MLNVNLDRCISVTAILDPACDLIASTDNGKLEKTFFSSSKLIIKFFRDMPEGSRIDASNTINWPFSGGLVV